MWSSIHRLLYQYVIALRSIPRITSKIFVPPDVIQHSSGTIPIRIHSSRHNAFDTGLIPTNTAFNLFGNSFGGRPQHAAIPLNAGSYLCSSRIRYRTGCFSVGSREYASEFVNFTLTLGIGKYSNFRYFSWHSVVSSLLLQTILLLLVHMRGHSVPP